MSRGVEIRPLMVIRAWSGLSAMVMVGLDTFNVDDRVIVRRF
jgi:hypothetical protein